MRRDKFLNEIRQTLKENADEKVRENSKRYFKSGEESLVYGIKAPVVRGIGKEFKKRIKKKSKSEVFEICEELWKSKYFEEAVIACIFSESLHKQYEPADFRIFERWIKNYVNNWADCDTLCNHTIGTFIMMYPDYIGELKNWAKSSNRWVRRASAVTLIIPARKGMFLKDIFEMAEILLTDEDDLVQKG